MQAHFTFPSFSIFPRAISLREAPATLEESSRVVEDIKRRHRRVAIDETHDNDGRRL
jgi:hypothetical protein